MGCSSSLPTTTVDLANAGVQEGQRSSERRSSTSLRRSSLESRSSVFRKSRMSDVKQPMDLKTIGAKNDGGEYAGLGSLAKDALKGDVELMFSNAVAYNGADHWIAGDVTQLKVVTDALFASDVAPTFPTLEAVSYTHLTLPTSYPV